MKPKDEIIDPKRDAEPQRRKLIADFPSGILLSVCLEDLLTESLLEEGVGNVDTDPEPT